MQSEQDIRELKEELDKLTGFIGDFCTNYELQSKNVQFGCNVCDALAWVLEEIQTVRFRSDDYLRLSQLKYLAREIEIRTSRKLANY